MLSFNTACRASLVHWLTKPVIMDMEFSPHHIKGFTNYIKMNNTTISVETKLRKKKMKLKSSRNLSIGNGLLPLMHPDVTEKSYMLVWLFFFIQKSAPCQPKSKSGATSHCILLSFICQLVLCWPGICVIFFSSILGFDLVITFWMWSWVILFWWKNLP